MNVTCPHCTARFRVADEKLTGKKLALRCARCGKVFPVDSSAPDSMPGLPDGGYVLVAHSDPALCETIGDLLSRNKIVFEVVSDGATALQVMDKKPPQVVIVDVALPGLFAFEVVDKVRSRPGLNQVKIILLSSVYNKMAYKCRPKSLYGADDYIEKHHLPDSLVPKINDLTSTAPTPASAHPVKPSDPDDWEEVNEAIRQAEEQEVTTVDRTMALEKARRLARIIVSDIALYNQERIESVVANGRFEDVFSKEIAEGNKIFSERVDADIIGKENFLINAFAEFIRRRQQEMIG